MDVAKVNQILRVAKMYYEMGLGQLEIGKRENISKSTVSRLLKSAQELGFVKISIEKPLVFMADVENEIKDKFGLDRVTVVPVMVNDAEVILKDVCERAAQDLPKYIKDGSVLAFAWGRTITELTRHLPPMNRSGVQVVQMNGGTSKLLYSSGAEQILKSLKEAMEADAYQFPSPAVVDNVTIADAIKSDSQIRSVLGLCEQADVALFSVGRITKDALLSSLAGFSDEEYGRLKSSAVGDVASHYLDAEGNLADESFDVRVVAADAEKIKKIPNKILVASGVEKADVLRAALLGGYCNTLYIDENLAKKLLAKS